MGIHVLILAEVAPGSIGGGESVIHGLLRGLTAIDRGEDTFTILCHPAFADQLRPLLGSGMKVASRPAPTLTVGNVLRRLFGPLRRPLGQLLRKLRGEQQQGLPVTVPVLDDFVLSLGADVIHFMVPQHYASAPLPTVFTVHDLQHEQLPWIFNDDHIRYRRMLYDAIALQCTAIVAISQFTAGEFRQHHPLPADKLCVIPWASYLDPHDTAALSQNDQRLLDLIPEEFILYPAFSYRHKNHTKLLEALSLLEQRHGLHIPLVCTGGRSEYWPQILEYHNRLSPQPELHDLAYVSKPLLYALYRKARYVVFPTLFEGAGLPLLEAIALKVPIVCSDIPPLREFGGDGPGYFEPDSVESMTAAMREFWLDAARRREAALRAQGNLTALTWEDCARKYLQVYRNAATSLQ